MSYAKAMRHTRNVRKVRAQSRMHFGFDTGTGAWPNPRRNPETAKAIEIQEWFKDRHKHGDAAHVRACIRESIAELRSIRSQPPANGGHDRR